MTNMYANSGAGPVPGQPVPGQPVPGQPVPGEPGPSHPAPRRRAGRVAAVIVACAVAAGGSFAVVDAVTGPGHAAAAASTSAGTGSASASRPTGAAAVLNSVLADAAPGSAKTALRRINRALARLRRLGGMYGQYTIETKSGPRTLAFERGTITSITGPDVTVRAADGTTWTWVLVSASVVRRSGARTRAAALAGGESVFAAGLLSGTARDARLVVIRLPAKAKTKAGAAVS